MKNYIKILKLINSYDKTFLPWIGLYSLIGGLFPLLNVLVPKMVIDELLSTRRMEMLIFYILLMAFGNWTISYFLRFILLKIDRIIEVESKRLEFKVMEKLNQFPIEISESKSHQDHVEQVIYGIDQLFFLPENISIICKSVVSIVFLIVIIGRLNFFIPIIMIGTSLLVLPILNLQKKIEEDNVRRSQPEHRAYTYFLRLARDFRYAKDLKLFDGRDFMMKKATKFMDRILNINHEYYTKNGIYEGLKGVISQIQIILFTLYLSFQFSMENVLVGSFVMYVNSAIQLNRNVMEVLSQSNRIITMSILFDPMIDYLELEMEEEENKKVINPEEVELEFVNVSFRYPFSEKFVLENCNFKINLKERVALVGKNGSGKSTIIKLICGFYKPIKGVIKLNGIDIREIDKDSYCNILSITFQNFRIFPFKISENIAYKKEELFNEKDINKINSSLEKMNLKNWIDSLPDKESTYVSSLFSDEGVLSSGGQGQKIALSRSLFHDGPFVIMDEPTAALDPRSEEEIFNHMLSVSQNKTSLFISHRLSSTQYADRILVCDEGKIVEEGNHRELMEKEGLYSKMFTVQANQYRNFA